MTKWLMKIILHCSYDSELDSNYLQKDDEEPGEDNGGGGGELNNVGDDLEDAAADAKDKSEEVPNKSAKVVEESDNVPVSGSSNADAKEEWERSDEETPNAVSMW